MTKINTKSILHLLTIVLGNSLCAFAIAAFVIPNGLIMGGATGVGLFFNHLFSIPTSAVVFLFNVSVLVLGWIFVGRRFALTSIFSTFFFPFMLSVFENLPAIQHLTSDNLLSAIIGGAGIGIGMGFVLKVGASTGGTDIPPVILNKLFGLPISATLTVLDITILLMQGVVSTPEQILYGIIVVATYTTMINRVLQGGKQQTQVKIISDKYEEINYALQKELVRGNTFLHAETGYLRKETRVMLIIISNRELVKLNRIVMSIDPKAFMVINQVAEVQGRGFSFGKFEKLDPGTPAGPSISPQYQQHPPTAQEH